MTFSGNGAAFNLNVLNSDNNFTLNLDGTPSDFTLNIDNEFNVATNTGNLATVKLENGSIFADSLNIATAPGSIGNFELLDNIDVNISNNVTIGGSSGMGTGFVRLSGGGGSGAELNAFNVFLGTVGSSGPIDPNTMIIDYDGKLTASNELLVGENGFVSIFMGEIDASIVSVYGRINGTGTITASDETVFIQGSGVISPDDLESGGITIQGDIVFETGSIFESVIAMNEGGDLVSSLLTISDTLLPGEGNIDIMSGSFLNILLFEDLIAGDNFDVLFWDGDITGTFVDITIDPSSTGSLPIGHFFEPFYQDLGSGKLTITVVPEPSTWALMGLGCIFIFWRFRRRS